MASPQCSNSPSSCSRWQSLAAFAFHVVRSPRSATSFVAAHRVILAVTGAPEASGALATGRLTTPAVLETAACVGAHHADDHQQNYRARGSLGLTAALVTAHCVVLAMSASQTQTALTTPPAGSAHTAAELAVGVGPSAHAHDPGLFLLGSTLGERHTFASATVMAALLVVVAVQRASRATATLAVAGAGLALADDLVALGNGVSSRAHQHRHCCRRHGPTDGNTTRAALVAAVPVAAAVVEALAPFTLRSAPTCLAATTAQAAAGVSTASCPDGASRDLKRLGNHRKHAHLQVILVALMISNTTSDSFKQAY